jgi:hypothetical protein
MSRSKESDPEDFSLLIDVILRSFRFGAGSEKKQGLYLQWASDTGVIKIPPFETIEKKIRENPEIQERLIAQYKKQHMRLENPLEQIIRQISDGFFYMYLEYSQYDLSSVSVKDLESLYNGPGLEKYKTIRSRIRNYIFKRTRLV